MYSLKSTRIRLLCCLVNASIITTTERTPLLIKHESQCQRLPRKTYKMQTDDFIMFIGTGKHREIMIRKSIITDDSLRTIATNRDSRAKLETFKLYIALIFQRKFEMLPVQKLVYRNLYAGNVHKVTHCSMQHCKTRLLNAGAFAF